MACEIYYFSGTGNTLYAAKYLAGKTEARLISIAKALKGGPIDSEADSIGIVFPVYFASNKDGVPPIIKRFVNSLEDLNGKYVFAVCTSGYMPGTTIGSLAKIIKRQGGRLSAGFVVNMAQGSLKEELAKKAKQVAGKEVGEEKIKEEVSQNPEDKLGIIAETVIQKESAKLETRGLFGKILNAPLRALIKPIFLARYSRLSGGKSIDFWKLVPHCDNGFDVNEACTGCGICAKVCPSGNIKINDGKPEWHNSCENCLACYVWCPQKAICGEMVKYNPNVHHTGVKLADML